MQKLPSDHIELFRCIVGSQAHGLATPESDTDTRGVFVVRTKDILSLGGHYDETRWIEGNDDDCMWEVGKFLLMATKCNPTVLETFLSPIQSSSIYGDKIREAFEWVWNSNDVMNAFIGYGLNQRKKFLDDKDKRKDKYAVAYLRTLYNAWELLSTGYFHVDMRGTPVYDDLWRFKRGEYQAGEVIDKALYWEKKVKDAYADNPNKKTDLNRINSILHDIRYFYW